MKKQLEPVKPVILSFDTQVVQTRAPSIQKSVVSLPRFELYSGEGVPISLGFECYYCGAIIDDLSLTTCPECHKSIIRCEICKRPLKFSQPAAKCLYCDTIFHPSHIQEVVKISGKCPVCQKEISIEEIVPVIPSGLGKKKYH